jgi:hypothetical protein
MYTRATVGFVHTNDSRFRGSMLSPSIADGYGCTGTYTEKGVGVLFDQRAYHGRRFRPGQATARASYPDSVLNAKTQAWGSPHHTNLSWTVAPSTAEVQTTTRRGT